MRRPRRRARGRRTWPQRLLITVNLLIVVAALAAAGGLTLVRRELAELPVLALEDQLAEPVSVDEPRNFLIIGTDSAAGLDEDDPVRRGRTDGLLADVIMVLRIDPTTESASLLSIPRDTWVPIGASGTRQKINAAISGPDGPATLIETLRSSFGVEVNHYVQVDFQGFKELVEVLGGIPVYLETPIRDRRTGLLLDRTGCTTLNPDEALAYARSRALQYQDADGTWRGDPTGDLGRISRQQEFLRLALQRAIDRGARNPVTALNLLNAATRSVTLDTTLTVGDLLEVGRRFQSFNPADLATFQLPTYGDSAGAASIQRVDDDAAEPVLAAFRGESPATTTTAPPPPPTTQLPQAGEGTTTTVAPGDPPSGPTTTTSTLVGIVPTGSGPDSDCS